MERAEQVYRQHGLETVARRAIRKLLAPVVRLGVLYFFECDLRKALPDVRPVPGITVREAFLSDLHLLDGTTEETGHTRREAVDRLRKGHRWFVGIEDATGKLTNYRWVATETAFIPEIGCDLVVGRGEAYVYDLVTIPEFRRRGIDSYTRQYVYNHLHSTCGIVRILAYILPGNYESFRAARRFLEPIGHVRHLCLPWLGKQFFFARDHRLPQFREVGTMRTGQPPLAQPPHSD